jgi:hypothetical protein
MPWTCERLESEWINGKIEVLGDQASSVLKSFETVEKHLGDEWLSTRRLSGTGISPTLSIVLLGECLAAIENLNGYKILVNKYLANDFSALSEMKAIRMFDLMGEVEIELEPNLKVGDTTKKPDFRVRRNGESTWTYVEVTCPDTSKSKKSADKLLTRLQSVKNVRRDFSMEIFLRCIPNIDEESEILNIVQELAESYRYTTVDLPGVALITKQAFTKTITLIDHPDEDNSLPRMSKASIFCPDATKPSHMIFVRMPFTDERAESSLNKKAEQLSCDEKGLIIMDMQNVISGIKIWKPLIQRRLQPNINTRVGGVCLFSSGLESGIDGLQHILFNYGVIKNDYASQQLSEWIFDGIQKIESVANSKRVLQPSKIV